MSRLVGTKCRGTRSSPDGSSFKLGKAPAKVRGAANLPNLSLRGRNGGVMVSKLRKGDVVRVCSLVKQFRDSRADGDALRRFALLRPTVVEMASDERAGDFGILW